MRFTPKQAYAALYGSRKDRQVILDGPRRSGKTECALQGFASGISEALSGYACPIVAPSQVQMDKLFDRVVEYYEDRGGYVKRVPNHKSGKAYEVPSTLGRKPNQIVQIIADGSEKAAARCKSVEFGWAFFDEFTDIHGLKPEQQEVYRQIEAGTWTVGDKARIIATTNPEGPFHPVYTDMIMSKKWKRIHFELADNDALTPSMIEDIKGSNTGVWYQRNVLGLWVAADGLVHPTFEESDSHIGTFSPVPEGQVPVARIVALDFGNHGITTAGLFVEYQDYWHLESEWTWDAETQGHLPPSQLAERIYDWATAGYRAIRVFLVPEDASGVAEGLGKYAEGTSAGIYLPYQYKTPGINYLNMKLEGTGRCGKTLLVGNAPRFKREASSYVWDRKAAARGEDKPDKASGLGAHACDYARYFAATDEAIRRGEYEL